MAIHPNSGVEFDAKDPDGYPVDDGTPKQSASYVDGSTSFEGAGDWPPQGSAIGLPDGHEQRGSTGQLFKVANGQWQRVVEPEDSELGYDKSSDGLRSGEPFPPKDRREEKRKTVNVRNEVGRSLMLHLHATIQDDGGGRSFQGRLLESNDPMLPDAVSLRAGANAGIDKKFFDMWREQNKGSSLLPMITAEDEDDKPESAQREE